MEYVITFKNTNFAIKAEKGLLEQKIGVTVMPLPSQIRAGCGICLKIKPDEIRHALKVMTVNNIDDICVYSRTAENNKIIYAEINNWDILT